MKLKIFINNFIRNSKEKDRIINLMAEYIAEKTNECPPILKSCSYNNDYENPYCEVKDNNIHKCWIEFFKEKVKDSKKYK